LRNKIILSHATGNANVRGLLEGLIKNKALKRFYTCLAWSNSSLVLQVFSEFRKRSYDASILNVTQRVPFKEFIRLLGQRFGWTYLIRHEKGQFSIDAVNRKLDKSVAQELQAGDTLYAYEDAAYLSFTRLKEIGGTCIYDLPIGYWRAMRELLNKERDNRPEWAMTITGFKDSDEKVMRKDKELQLADLIYVASSFTQYTLQAYPGKLAPIKVVPYGFPPVYSKRDYRVINPGETLKLLFVGGLSQRKGIANVFEAVEAFNSVSLTVIGRKPVANCKPLNENLKKHRYIESLEHNKVLEEMRNHDILLFPSLFEGYGLVITEAMAQGTPVITTTRTCGADYIIEGKNGWLVQPGSTKAIIDCLQEILRAPNSISKIGLEAQKTAELYPMSSYGQRLLTDLRSKC